MPDTTTLATLVSANPSAARVLEQFGLDYCCGGHKTLSAACSEKSVAPEDVLAAVADVSDEEKPDWTALGLSELVDHIETTHHAFLHSEMPRLIELADKVAGVHGDNHPEVIQVRDTFATLVADLAPHLMKEERVLFPMIRELTTATSSPSFHCGSLRNPIGAMLMEHDTAGELLAKLSQLTNGYTPPADACGSYQALYTGLKELEVDVHMHIHIENNLLFPDAIALECELA